MSLHMTFTLSGTFSQMVSAMFSHLLYLFPHTSISIRHIFTLGLFLPWSLKNVLAGTRRLRDIWHAIGLIWRSWPCMDKLVMFAKAKLVCGKWSRLSANTFVGFGWLAMPVCTTLRMLRIYLRQQRQLRSSFIIHVHTVFAQEISTTVRDPSQIFLSGPPSTRRRWLRKVKQSSTELTKDGTRQSLITSFFRPV